MSQDEEIRALERRLAAAKVRAGVSPKWLLQTALEHVSNRMYGLERRYRKITTYNLEADKLSDRTSKIGYAQSLCGGLELLHRRWRSLYREWLRVTGNRHLRDHWLGPRPPCVCPGGPDGKFHTNCGTFKIVLMPGPKHTWLKTAEWSQNSRFIDRGRRRKKIMEELEAKKKLQEAQ